MPLRTPPKAIVIILVVFTVFGLTKNWIAKLIIENRLGVVTGLRVHVDQAHLEIFTTRVRIRGLEAQNPPGFEESVMVRIPEAYVDYAPTSLLKGGVGLNEVQIHLSEFLVAKNGGGQLNINAIKEIRQRRRESQAKMPSKARKRVSIGTLKLRIDRVLYRDNSAEVPVTKEFRVNIHEEHKNIENMRVLVKLVVFKALAKTTVGSLAGFDTGPLREALSETLSGTAEKAFGLFKDALEGVSGAVKGR